MRTLDIPLAFCLGYLILREDVDLYCVCGGTLVVLATLTLAALDHDLSPSGPSLHSLKETPLVREKGACTALALAADTIGRRNRYRYDPVPDTDTDTDTTASETIGTQQ